MIKRKRVYRWYSVTNHRMEALYISARNHVVRPCTLRPARPHVDMRKPRVKDVENPLDNQLKNL